MIGLTKGTKWINKAIRYFGKIKTGAAEYDHAYLRLANGLIVEATWRGLRINKQPQGGECVEFKPTFLTLRQKKEIEERALRVVGTSQGLYGYLKIPAFALDSIFKTYWFTQHIGSKHFKVCSQFVAWLYYSEGYEKFKNWRSMSPDDLDDFFLTHPDEWKRRS